MQSLHKLIGNNNFFSDKNLKVSQDYYNKVDEGEKDFIDYMALVQKNLGSCDPFAPCYKCGGGLNA